jgi:dGTPase
MTDLYARYSEELGKGRTHDEHVLRSPVAKDRDRIIHSGALRRLQRKSQIVGVQSNDFFRTRLTHTLECAQIGRAIALRSRETDELETVVEDRDHLPPLVEAACYAHDLGHAPFGHNGEQELRDLMKAHGRGLFEGNAQSFRIVTQLESVFEVGGHWCGLDLTRTTLKAILKYPKTEFQAKAAGETKFCIYDEEHDLAVYDWLYDGIPRDKREGTLATEILDVSDDIAYGVHDFEDGVWAGRIPLFRLVDDRERAAHNELAMFLKGHKPTLFPSDKEFEEALAALLTIPKEADWARTPFDRSLHASASLKNFVGHLIGDLIAEVTPEDKFTPPSNETARKLELLKAMARIWMIEHPDEETLRHGQRRLVRDLFEGYWENPNMLPSRETWQKVAAPENADFDASRKDPGTNTKDLDVWRAKARQICDHIAGMTDLFALHAHSERYGGGAAPNLRLLV